MTPTPEQLRDLGAYFHPDDLEFKPITTKDGKGLAAAYVTNRAVQARFDSVVGAGLWRNEYKAGPAGGVLCGLSVRITYEDGTSEWVTKWDGADNTDIEATKGGLSDSMRRAAVQWGVGRYLYEFPSQWVPMQGSKFTQTPSVPRQFKPGQEPWKPKTNPYATSPSHVVDPSGDGASASAAASIASAAASIAPPASVATVPIVPLEPPDADAEAAKKRLRLLYRASGAKEHGWTGADFLAAYDRLMGEHGDDEDTVLTALASLAGAPPATNA